MKISGYLKIRETSKCIGELDEICHKLSYLNNSNEVMEMRKIVVRESILNNNTIGLGLISYTDEWNEILDKMKIMSTSEDGYEIARLIRTLIDKIKDNEKYIKGYHAGGIFITVPEYLVALAAFGIFLLVNLL